MSLSAEPIFIPALASLDGLVPHDGLLFPTSSRVWRARSRRGPTSGSPLSMAIPSAAVTSSSTRTTVWTRGSCPGCPVREQASTTTTSPGRLCVARGCVREDIMVYGGEPQSRRLREGSTRQGGPGYIHRVNHDEGMPAVTVHVFPAARLGRPVPARRGRRRSREVRPGRNELTEQLIADGALEHVLERF